MPWTTGTVSTFTNKFISTPETIGTGDGVDTTFSYTVTKPPIFIAGVKISYVIATVTYTPTSDANGNFTGTGLTSGTVTEAGFIDLVFSTPPDNLSLIRVTEYTTKGLLQKMIDYVVTNKFTQTVGTGDGATTVFSNTLTNTTVAKGQCRIRFKIAGVIYWVWDNGNGQFEHSLISTSSLTYASGAISITFTTAVDNLYVIEALYTTGIEGRDWLILHEDISQDNVLLDAFPGLLLKQYVLRNSGKNWAEHIVLGFRESQRISTNQYLIELNLHIQWAETEDTLQNWNVNAFQISYDTTTEHWTLHPSSAFNDAPATYWIKATKDYIFFEVKVSGTVYTGFYGGNGIRFSSIQDYQNPNIILANSSGNFVFSSVASTHTMIIDPVGTNQVWAINKENQLMNFSDFKILPANDYLATGDMEKTTNTKVPMNEVFLEKFDPLPNELLFQVRDLYHTPYVNMSTEDTLSEGADSFTVFQNIFRTSTPDYFAVKTND